MDSVSALTHTILVIRRATAAGIVIVACLSPAGTAHAAGADAHASCMGLGLSTAAPGIIAPGDGLTPRDVAGIAALYAHERKELAAVPGTFVAPSAQTHAGSAEACFAE